MGPSLIKAGKGSATFADIKDGDKVKVYGEVMVQGGIRAMEITLPKERMSIPPTPKVKPVKAAKTETPKDADKTDKKADDKKKDKKAKGKDAKNAADQPKAADEKQDSK